MWELTPKISWRITRGPRSFPCGAARYLASACPSSVLRGSISPIAVRSFRARGAHTLQRAAGERERQPRGGLRGRDVPASGCALGGAPLEGRRRRGRRFGLAAGDDPVTGLLDDEPEAKAEWG